ncbi:MAG: hypothetical protein HRT57_12435, partial [Crocinitomicaceae bacterium]|nr:hypothetical protein [Crocinitomicaceae bacterium]
PYNGGSFFPVTEREYDIVPAIIDSTKQYYDIAVTLFRKHLFELSGKDYHIGISPMLNLSKGKDFADTTDRKLFQNTRGFIVEGDFFTNFSFMTSFYENQARFTQYQSNIYSALGELYPSGNYYQTQNAVIPGSGRTKEFKTSGFDYAYAIGNIVYTPIKQLTLSTGNNQHFIGDGHRSLLLSDNSYSAPYFMVDWQISPKFRFSYMRSRLMNLIRKPTTSSVESFYEAKGYSVNYFTYQPNDKINVSLFEGAIWNRGDSVTSHTSHPMFYNPIPVLSSLTLMSKGELNSIIGINLGVQLADKHRAYGQIALNGSRFDKLGFQVGYRGYNFFGLKDFMIQSEYNYVPLGLYEAENKRLSYSHYNMSLGHSHGNGFQEILLRSNYEFKRFYAELSLNYYILEDYEPLGLLPVTKASVWYNPESFTVLNTSFELGYRINRKLNFTVFTAATIRGTTRADNVNTSFLNLGIRTDLNNHYSDF